MAATARADDSTALTIWSAQSGPQSALIACPIFEVFFGGSRGGGKTDGVLGDFLEHADAYGEDAIGLMIRKERTQLIETIERSRQIYTPLGWTYHEQDKMWRAPNGARLRFAYLERDADAEAYQGHSYTRVYVEEIGNFPTAAPILKLMATLRSGAGVPVGFRATGNPGGPGHQWVKSRYIDPAPLGWKVIRDSLSGLERVYIPSRVSDNKFLGEDYVQRLRASGSKELVRAWLEGDWSVIEGAFFDCWSNEKHVIAPFAIPDDWLRFRSMDWGSAAPFSVGWWAVVGDNHIAQCNVHRTSNLDVEGAAPGNIGEHCNAQRSVSQGSLPRGAIVRYREWYGASAPGVGLKFTAEEVGLGILAKEQGEKITYGVLDPSAFAVDGGPSIAERIAAATQSKVTFRRADNKRVSERGAMGGWDQLRARMKGDGERPMIYCFSTCKDSIRSIPALQHDPDRPEDLDTNSDDHCFAAGTMVATPSGPVAIENLPEEGIVLTPVGPRPYRSARLTRRNAEVIRLEFSNGSSVICTKDHRFLADTDEWRYASDLKGRSILCSQLSSAPRSKSSMASDIISAESTFSGTAFAFTSRFGNITTARSQPGTMCITPTMTVQIIAVATLSAFRCLSIWAGDTVGSLASAVRKLCRLLEQPPHAGMVPLKGKIGIGSTTPSIAPLSCAGQKQSRAVSVVGHSRPQAGSEAGFVLTHASRHGDGLVDWTTSRANARSVASGSWLINTARRAIARVIVGRPPAVKRGLVCLNLSDAGRSDVYCLTVPSVGCFILANGAIVSNCADEWRYAAMSRPWVPSKPEDKRPTELIFEAQPDGRVVGNMSVFEIVEQKRKKKLAEG